jgi:hypothetical protein
MLSGTFIVGGVKVFRHYLAVININTKYLFMEPLAQNVHETLEITTVLIRGINERLKAEGKKIEHLRGDGDTRFGTLVAKFEDQTKGLWKVYKQGKQNRVILGEMTFVANTFTLFCKDSGITLFLNSSKFTNKNRVVDRVIRTIKDKIGENAALLLDPNIVAAAVKEYNNTPHAALLGEFTPNQVQHSTEMEEYFIRENQMILERMNNNQAGAGYFKYQKGNILLIHIDLSKTQQKFRKQRRVFNQLAEFIEYEHGNVKCKTLNTNSSFGEVVIPIYYTKLISMDRNSIPEEYKQLLI